MLLIGKSGKDLRSHVSDGLLASAGSADSTLSLSTSDGIRKPACL